MGHVRLLSSVALFCVGALLLVSSPADAKRLGVKFSAAEFRVQQTVIDDGDGSPVRIEIELMIKGRTGSGGPDEDGFEYTVPNAGVWLGVLQACAGSSARLSGVVAPEVTMREKDGGRGAKTLEGTGGLYQLTCRQILK